MSVAPAAVGSGRERADRRFVDPTVLARIDNLALVARMVVDGFLSGLHRALHLGVSTDFAEHRGYVPGDDLRHVDWRVYGRTDRLYVNGNEGRRDHDDTHDPGAGRSKSKKERESR